MIIKYVFTAIAAVSASVMIAGAAELEGTSWQLVEIQSMDDRVMTPTAPANYTLEFQENNKAAIQADCNRGMASWTSESASQLQFGPVASTRALCPAGSISDTFLAQFEWVRSFVMKDGHLYLATMADGYIIKFAPLCTIAVTVYGETICMADAATIQDAVLTRIFDRYAADKGIDAEPAEVNALVAKLRVGMDREGRNDEDSLTPEESAEVETMRREMARSMIRQWKINKALHDEFGGRLIYQQLGPEPLDAYKSFLETLQRSGAFTFLDPSLAGPFWSYFTDESRHDFMEPGSADEKRAFTAPPWRAETE